MTNPMDSVPMPEPSLFIGTKLVPYHERAFNTPELAEKLGYTHSIRSYYTEEQVRSAYEMGRNAGLEEAAQKCESLIGDKWVIREAALQCADEIRSLKQ